MSLKVTDRTPTAISKFLREREDKEKVNNSQTLEIKKIIKQKSKGRTVYKIWR